MAIYYPPFIIPQAAARLPITSYGVFGDQPPGYRCDNLYSKIYFEFLTWQYPADGQQHNNLSPELIGGQFGDQPPIQIKDKLNFILRSIEKNPEYQTIQRNFFPLKKPFYISTKFPLMSLRVNGLWRDQWIFEVRHGKQYIRAASSYDLAPKEYLKVYQDVFAQGVHAWQSLTPEIKAKLNSRASKLGLRLAGYHYFLRLWLKNKPALKQYYPAGRP
jgi:hypothetical protein